MKDELVQLCAANVRDTCHLVMQTIGVDISRRPDSVLSLSETIAMTRVLCDDETSSSPSSESLLGIVAEPSDMIGSLTELGYVTCVPAANDGRGSRLIVTKDGRRALEVERSNEMRCLTDALSQRSPAECAMLSLAMDLLRGVIASQRS